MIEGFPLLNISIEIAGIMLCFLGILTVALARRTIAPVPRQYMVLFFACLTLDLVADITGEFSALRSGPFWGDILEWAFYLHFLFSPLLAFIVTGYFFSIVDPEKVRKRTRRAVGIMLLAYLLALLASRVFRLYFYIDDANVYHRGTWYSLSVLLSSLPLMVIFLGLVRDRDKLTFREAAAFWIYAFVPALAVFVQLFFEGIHIIIPATILAGLAMFVFLLTDQIERYSSQNRALTEMRIALMLSQIQPHFLYNALDSIYYLCAQDPRRAQAAIGRFARFLRVNLAALKQKEPVPFETERRHIETYLELEKLSLAGNLRYEFDCETEDFFVPVLTVQPLVENAVKHGLGEKQGGGTVRIRTRKTKDAVVVTVEDDGAGFSPGAPHADGRIHVGLENVRTRLAEQCGGSLTIRSSPGAGTTAVITIPGNGMRGKKKKQEEEKL